MIVLTSLYKLLIGPLELFFEVLFSITFRFVRNPGLSIVILSLAMNFLVLPLYRRADAMQEEERDRAARMKPWVDHIKKAFKGDERFMMLQAYYRECGYKQTDALKGSLSLLLEIPFFIAAFHFLSNLVLLRGEPFGPIPDLGAPDALIQLGGLSINLLPILMTAINVVSAAIYMKGFPLKNKVQMYGIAAIFLVLLYNSPAGLVFYWTLNNVFSLVKNIFYKLRNPRKVLAVLASLTGVALLVVVFVHPLPTLKKQLFLVACALALQLPLLAWVLRGRFRGPNIPEATSADGRTFLLGCIFFALMTGLLIPLSVIQASPGEFVNLTAYRSPLWYLLDSMLTATGTFVIWFGVFYRLASPKGKTVLCALLWLAAGAGLVTYLFFGKDYGNLSPLLQFAGTVGGSRREVLLNLAAIVAVMAALLFIWHKKRAVAKVGFLSMCVAILAISLTGMFRVNSALATVKASAATVQDQVPHFSLSRNGKNVVVLMMDRAISYYLPYIMYERPELQEQLDGFTFYPNTVSYGSSTNSGAPGLYGGYEYTPEKLNEQSDRWLGDKHDEALKVMPVLFDENGFDVTVFDPPYAGYGAGTDFSIYSDYPDIKTAITMNGQYEIEEFGTSLAVNRANSLRKRNFFCYSVVKLSPLLLQPTLYSRGDYNAAAMGNTGINGVTSPQIRYGTSRAEGVDELFIEAYAVLENLPNIAQVDDGDQGTFLMMTNDTTHSPTLLQEPEYIPAASVDNTEFDREHDVRYDAQGSSIDLSNDTDDLDTSKHMHYEINMASWLKLGEWCDYLRENGVYDNTRIIIVSDHASNLGLRDDLIMQTGTAALGGQDEWDVLRFNCMLMVKDFDATGFQVDDTFMTNADTPTLASAGLIDNPVNPFTGNPIDASPKTQGEQHLFGTFIYDIARNNGNEFLPGDWFAVHGNIFDAGNWRYLGFH
jgi:YidC/Oxa1 family membrane protein insertase